MADSKPSPEELRRRIEAIDLPKMQTERKSGCRNLAGCMLWPTIIVLVLCGIVGGVYYWHPWDYVSVVTAVDDDACPEGQEGVQTIEYLEILGVRIEQSGSATICVEN